MRLSLLIILLLSACTTSPTGRKQLAFMPDSQMNSMGAQAFEQMKEKTPEEKDPATNAYVKCVALAVAKEASDDTGVSEWEVVVFKDPTANAFALPGGKIGVHTGLLKVAINQHQLAAVLGHEVGHVIARHGNERVSEAFTVQGAMLAVSVANKNSPHHQKIMALMGLGAQFGYILPHSRTQESEADTIGLELMSRAGFDPRESVELWKNMSRAGGGQPPEFLSTHPSHETRIKDLNDRTGQMMPIYESAKTSGRTPNCKHTN